MSEPRWWGWLEPPAGRELGGGALRLLERELGATLPRRPPVPLEAVELPLSALSDRAARRLRDTVGDEHVARDGIARVMHAAGKGYADLVRMRTGDASNAPDAVIFPRSADEVSAILDVCSQERIAVIPFGGGTSVVGGVNPSRNGCIAAISLDLRRLDSLTVDGPSMTATFGAGLRAPAAEAALKSRGLTLGHFPQSFELVTIGGCVATRSAGQASTGYGRIDALVRGLRLRAPAGALDVPAVPASAAGPSLRELVVGSEGTLGVIVDATLSLRALPAVRHYEGWAFRGFAEGAHALRTLVQGGAEPDVARLSDEEETRLTLGLSARGSLAERGGRLYLRARGRAGGCLAIVGFEGVPREVARRRRRATLLLRRHGGLALGTRPGAAWVAARYAGPYLRDELLERGLLVETLETAATWTLLDRLYRGIRAAIRDALGERCLVGCHISHLYRSGASLYFTVIARADDEAPLDQWRAVKRAASEAIVAWGGTITHHHAIGLDHAPWMRAEVGELGLDVLAAVKRRLDPAGVMNPGKLAQPAPGPGPSARGETEDR